MSEYVKNNEHLLKNEDNEENKQNEQEDPVLIINSVSDELKNLSSDLDKLKKIVGFKKEEKKEKKKRTPQTDEEKQKRMVLPKWVYLKEDYLYKKKVEGSSKIELKKYVLSMLH